MITRQTSLSIFEDIPCLKPYADDMEKNLSTRRSEKSILALRDRFVGFARWAREVERQAEQQGKPVTVLQMPVLPRHIADYAMWLDDDKGLALSTIRGYVSALGALHVAAGFLNPMWSDEVRDALSVLRIKHAEDDLFRARALSEDEFGKILATIYMPRTTRGGKTERLETAYRRGCRDAALLISMIEAGMRRAEAINLTWGDVREKEDGSGQVSLPATRRDTNKVWLDVSQECSDALKAIRPKGASDDSRVFDLSRSQIDRRLKRMCEEVGIDSTGISADTPRATLRRRLYEKPMTLDDYGRRLRLQSYKLVKLYSDI